MNDLLTAISTGFVAFAATNIDDIAVLMLLFSQVNATFQRHHVIAGQYLGFSALVAASLLGFVGGTVVPHHWLGLLGLIPIGMGLGRLFDRGDEADDDPSMAITSQPTNYPRWLQWFGPQSLSVAAITIANGSDNVGIYTPLFAHSSVAQLVTTIAIFLSLVAVWCIIADRLARQAAVADWLSQKGQTIVPWVLIGLGIYIILDSGAMSAEYLATSCLCLTGLLWRPQRSINNPNHGE
jgi:cadmium resistance transport/sequestration family protein